MSTIGDKLVGMLVGLSRVCGNQISIISDIMDEKGGINDIEFNIRLLEMCFEMNFVERSNYLKLLSDHPEAVINPRKVAAEIPIIDVNNVFRQVIFAACGPSRYGRARNMARLSHTSIDCKNGSIILMEIMRFIIANPKSSVSSSYKSIIPKCAEYLDVNESFVRFMRDFEEPCYKSCENIYDYITVLIFIHDTEMLCSYDQCSARSHYSEFPLLEMLIGATYGVACVEDADSATTSKIIKLIEKLV
jgi:hypothetical protein